MPGLVSFSAPHHRLAALSTPSTSAQHGPWPLLPRSATTSTSTSAPQRRAQHVAHARHGLDADAASCPGTIYTGPAGRQAGDRGAPQAAHIYAHAKDADIVCNASNEEGDLEVREAPAQLQTAAKEQMLQLHEQEGKVEPKPWRVDCAEYPVPPSVPEPRRDVDVELTNLQVPPTTATAAAAATARSAATTAALSAHPAPPGAYFGAAAVAAGLMFFANRQGRIGGAAAPPGTSPGGLADHRSPPRH